jgi:hypothetical protein
LFVEVDDISKPAWRPVAAFASIKAAAKWLEDEGFKYVHGSNGIWINDTATARKNGAPNKSVSSSEGSPGSQGSQGEQQSACGVRRIGVIGKLGRMGATLHARKGNVAGDTGSGTTDKGDVGR